MENTQETKEKVETILINQLFAGSYLSEGYNIGHEVVNLFKADDGNNYVYITPSGKVDSKVKFDTVVFVQSVYGFQTMEVVMKAKGLHKVKPEELDSISYAGTKLKDIFNDNIHHGEKDSQKIETFATFRVDSVRFPKDEERIILTLDKNIIDKPQFYYIDASDRKWIVGRGEAAKFYLSQSEYKEAYKQVQAIINDNALWCEENTTSMLISDEEKEQTSPTFLQITKKEYDELVFSNLLAYYFKKAPEVFMKFAKEVLFKSDEYKNRDMSPDFEIIRESKNNIDIWIEDENNVIVIENKIKSKLNGKAKGEKDPDIKTQLDKYYKYTKKHCDENRKEPAFFIFTPNHNLIDRGESKYGDEYTLITYKQIYEFLDRNKKSYENDKYFNDFLDGLKLHTKTSAEMRLDIMRSRFLEKIKERYMFKNILYLHGIGSSGGGNTCDMLKKAFPLLNIISPELAVQPDAAMEQIENIVRENPQIDLIIGTSLGGFYAMQISGKLKLLINPALFAADDIPKAVGYGVHPFFRERIDGQTEYTVDDEFVAQLRRMQDLYFNKWFDGQYRIETFGFFGTQDEVVSHCEDFRKKFMKDHIATADFGHRLTEEAFTNDLIPFLEKIYYEWKHTNYEFAFDI